MAQRLDLQAKFEAITPNVYFQPPPKHVMVYPCIVYSRSRIEPKHANNKPFNLRRAYEVKVIDRNPDSALLDAVASLPLCKHETSYTADQLHHDVFKIYF